jgi:hypothetical protein
MFTLFLPGRKFLTGRFRLSTFLYFNIKGTTLAGNFQPSTFLITTEAASGLLKTFQTPFTKNAYRIIMVAVKTTTCNSGRLKPELLEVFPKCFSVFSSNYRGDRFPPGCLFLSG